MKPAIRLSLGRGAARYTRGPLHAIRALPKGTVVTVEVRPAAVLAALASEAPLSMDTLPIAGPVLLSPSDGSAPLLFLPSDPRHLRELVRSLP